MVINQSSWFVVLEGPPIVRSTQAFSGHVPQLFFIVRPSYSSPAPRHPSPAPRHPSPAHQYSSLSSSHLSLSLKSLLTVFIEGNALDAQSVFSVCSYLFLDSLN
ncbi:hypothetical protein HN51_061512 [Arachis hypogaea]